MPIPTITKQFSITATPDVMKRFENFLAFMHFNGGHSGCFAMPFDGDGSDTLRCDPAPVCSEGVRKSRHRISGTGCDFEVALNNSYEGVSMDKSRNRYVSEEGKLVRITPDGMRIEIER